MKLKRNDPIAQGRGKYGVIRYDRVAKLKGWERAEAEVYITNLLELGVLTDGKPGTEDEFFVLMLKDVCARTALLGYADAALTIIRDPEYADDVYELASRAGVNSPFSKKPD